MTPEAIKSLEQMTKFQAGAWEQVVASARRLGMMETFHSCEDGANRYQVNQKDVPRYVEMMLQDLRSDIRYAILQDTEAGRALQKSL